MSNSLGTLTVMGAGAWGTAMAKVAADAAYIAACAGAAEAGWRSTIAAIDTLRLVWKHTTPNSEARAMTESILTAWEGIV